MPSPTRKSIALDGRTISYLDAGAGNPLVLLHAFPLSASMWLPQLAAALPNWRLIAPDLRGFGGSPLQARGSQEAPPSLTMDEYASDVLRLLKAERIDRAVIGGLSMGGYVAFALWAAAPSSCAGLILADTRASSDTDEARENRYRLAGVALTRGTAAVADEFIPKLLGETTRKQNASLEGQIRGLVLENSPGGISAALHAIAKREDFRDRLPSIECETLIVVGADDVLTPVSDSQFMKDRIPRAELRIIPEAGHLSNLEQPARFNEALTGFVAARTFFA